MFSVSRFLLSYRDLSFAPPPSLKQLNGYGIHTFIFCETYPHDIHNSGVSGVFTDLCNSGHITVNLHCQCDWFAITGDGKGRLWYVSVELEGMCDPSWMCVTLSTGLQIKENQRGGESQSHVNIPLLGPVGRVLFLSTMLSSLCLTNPSETVSLNKPFLS